MIEKKTYCDKAEYIPPFAIQCRQRVAFVEDGVEQSASFHRMVLHPDSDWSQCEANVQAICNAVFTDQVKADWEAKKAADAAALATEPESVATETPTE